MKKFIQVTDTDDRGHHINIDHIIQIIHYPHEMILKLSDDYEVRILPEEFRNNVYPTIYESEV